MIRTIEDNGGQIKRGELRRAVTDYKFEKSTFRKVLKNLVAAGNITLKGRNQSCNQIVSKV